MRVCDRCGTKQAPYQPRVRVGEELLCRLCSKKPAGVSGGGVIAEPVTVEAIKQAPEPDPKDTPEARMDPAVTVPTPPEQMPLGFGMDGGDDDWGTPKDNLPGLLQPLPNSIWEAYAKKRKFMGKSLLPTRAREDLRKKAKRLRGPQPKKAILVAWEAREALAKTAHTKSGEEGDGLHNSKQHQEEHQEQWDPSYIPAHHAYAWPNEISKGNYKEALDHWIFHHTATPVDPTDDNEYEGVKAKAEQYLKATGATDDASMGKALDELHQTTHAVHVGDDYHTFASSGGHSPHHHDFDLHNDTDKYHEWNVLHQLAPDHPMPEDKGTPNPDKKSEQAFAKQKMLDHLQDSHEMGPNMLQSFQKSGQDPADYHSQGHKMHESLHGHSHPFPDPIEEKDESTTGPLLPHTKGKDDVIEHLQEHHPEVAINGLDYDASPFKEPGNGGLKAWHEHLHSDAAEDSAPENGHTHADPVLPPSIDHQDHLNDAHGWTDHLPFDYEPHEYSSQHEWEHARGDDDDIGHSHDYPGGPAVEPRTHLRNPHHTMFHPEDPASHEWYHGTPRTYEGPPQSTTENKEQGNPLGYGEGDWNCHVGSHWSSLHEMAKNFHGNTNRVIHARLKMKNPKVYDNLNHMAHDAYERLHAQGEFPDGNFHNRHEDDSGYNQCCSNELLAYAKGNPEHRDDGKNGLQKYRDSLRADGHDGILVRNQADHPSGHWNAIPISPNQVELTDPHCPVTTKHNDARDNDVSEFNANHHKVMQQPDGSTWAKGNTKYKTPDDLPDEDQVKAIHEGGDPKDTKHADPDYHGDWSHGYHGGDPECNICSGYHWTDDHDEEGQWCGVCEEDGDHDDTSHPYCEHCEEHTGHESEEHEDEYGEHPDAYRAEDYCPHCGKEDKGNRNESECVNCGEQLPDWGQVKIKGMPHHEPVTDEEKAKVPKQPLDAQGHPKPISHGQYGSDKSWLKEHLDLHHGSDSEFKGWEKADGSTDDAAMAEHHKWLHIGGDAPQKAGFPANDHEHHDYKTHAHHDDMSDEEFHAHMVTHHSQLPKPDMSSPESIKNAKISHRAQHGAVQWGEAPSDQEGLVKATQDHNHEGDKESPGAKKTTIPVAHPHDIENHILTHHAGGHITTGLSEFKDGVSQKQKEAVHAALHQKYVATHSIPKWAEHTHAEDGTPQLTHVPEAPEGYQHGPHTASLHTAHLHEANDSMVHQGNVEGHIALMKHMALHHGEASSSVNNPYATLGQHYAMHNKEEQLFDHDKNDHNPTVPKELGGETLAHHVFNNASSGYLGYKNSASDVAAHMKDEHGYDGPTSDNGNAMHDIHAHFHSNSKDQPAGNTAVDHQHPVLTVNDSGHSGYVQNGQMVNPTHSILDVGKTGSDDENYLDPTIKGHDSKFTEHMDAYHPGVDYMSKEEAGKDAMTWQEYNQHLADTHEDHHHQDDNGLFHDHMSNPNEPMFADASKSDDLAKHMQSDHGWYTSKMEPMSHEQMVEHHMANHNGDYPHADDVVDPQIAADPKHSHDFADLNDLHSHPKTPLLPGHLPVVKDSEALAHHIAAHHSNQYPGQQQYSNENELSTKSPEELAALHDQHHDDQEINAKHTHIGENNDSGDFDAEAYGHLVHFHGVDNQYGAHMMSKQYWDDLHNELHGDDTTRNLGGIHPTQKTVTVHNYTGHYHNDNGAATLNHSYSPAGASQIPVKGTEAEIQQHMVDDHGLDPSDAEQLTHSHHSHMHTPGSTWKPIAANDYTPHSHEKAGTQYDKPVHGPHEGDALLDHMEKHHPDLAGLGPPGKTQPSTTYAIHAKTHMNQDTDHVHSVGPYPVDNDTTEQHLNEVHGVAGAPPYHKNHAEYHNGLHEQSGHTHSHIGDPTPTEPPPHHEHYEVDPSDHLKAYHGYDDSNLPVGQQAHHEHMYLHSDSPQANHYHEEGSPAKPWSGGAEVGPLTDAGKVKAHLIGAHNHDTKGVSSGYMQETHSSLHEGETDHEHHGSEGTLAQGIAADQHPQSHHELTQDPDELKAHWMSHHDAPGHQMPSNPTDMAKWHQHDHASDQDSLNTTIPHTHKGQHIGTEKESSLSVQSAMEDLDLVAFFEETV